MSLVHEIDYGTPPSRGTDQVTLTIDGQAVTVPAGTSISSSPSSVPIVSVLEGGYSNDLPELILAYLRGLDGK